MDAETSQPLEGVVVTANWELEIGTVGGNVAAGQIMVMETVTDSNGRFYFPAWGPIAVPATMPHPLKSQPHLVNRDPQIILFKSGYKWVGLVNITPPNYNQDSLRKSEWNGRTIKIHKFAGSSEEYARHLTSLSISMGFAFRSANCEWKQTPRMLALLFSEAESLRKRGANTGGIDDPMALPHQAVCGSATEVLKGYLNLN